MDPFGDDEPDWATDDPFGDGEADGEGEGATDGAGARYGAEHILFLFDCDPSMFDKYVPCLAEENAGEDGEAEQKEEMVSPMDVAVEAAHRYLRTKIRDIAETRGGKRDGVGVVLYGCDPNRAMRKKDGDSPTSTMSSGEDSEGMEELPATHELLELTPPGIEHVLCLQDCRPHDDNTGGKKKWRDLGKEFARRKGEKDAVEEEGAVCTLEQGMKAAQKVFNYAKCVKTPGPSSKDPPDSKSVWIFTNRDDPLHGDDDQRTHQRTKMMRTVRTDCRENNIAVHVMPLPKEGGVKFDRELFYNEFTSRDNRVEDEENFVQSEEGGGGVLDVEAIVNNFQMSARRKRKYATVPLLLPGWKQRDSPGIMLDLFGMVQVRSKPAKVSVHQEKNRMTNRVTKRVNKETGEVVEKEDLHHFAELCGRVSVQPATIAKMKRASNSMEEAGLVLLGFRPMRLLPTTDLMARSALAISNNARVRGSGKALYNLKQSMVKKKVFAVGELLTRASATSRMIAMVPKNDETDGFLIISLPYKEDVRAVAQSDIGYADRSSVDSAKEMIAKSTLQFEDFAGSLPANPWLKHFFGYLESVSLGRPLGEVEDDAKMDAEMMRKTAGEEISSFSMSLPEDDVPVKKERKRKAPGAAAAAKPEFTKEAISERWQNRFKFDEIGDCTATELKEFLKGQGERVGGKKGDLVDRATRVIQAEIFRKS
ncbi:hypothetical protein ACHAXT_006686 [Thalassiosira profunda]